MNEAELFGQLVRAIRKSQKMNLGQLAEKANTGIKHLGRIERGEKQPSFELIVALARALRVSPSTFFRFENANEDPKFLAQQLQALVAKRDTKLLRKAYRVLQAALEP
jgi:transcriptional regulator with XRE-family HTH domain